MVIILFYFFNRMMVKEIVFFDRERAVLIATVAVAALARKATVVMVVTMEVPVAVVTEVALLAVAAAVARSHSFYQRKNQSLVSVGGVHARSLSHCRNPVYFYCSFNMFLSHNSHYCLMKNSTSFFRIPVALEQEIKSCFNCGHWTWYLIAI